MRGWARFCGWALAGFLLASILSQIGIFLAPLGVAVVLVMIRRTREARELLGAVAGVGCVATTIGLLHLSDGGCSTHHDARSTSISCGGFDGKPWLAAGLAIVAAALLAYHQMGRGSPA